MIDTSFSKKRNHHMSLDAQHEPHRPNQTTKCAKRFKGDHQQATPETMGEFRGAPDRLEIRETPLFRRSELVDMVAKSMPFHEEITKYLHT